MALLGHDSLLEKNEKILITDKTDKNGILKTLDLVVLL